MVSFHIFAVLLALNPIPRDDIEGWYISIDPESSETLGIVSVSKIGHGYFVAWTYMPKFDEDTKKIHQLSFSGQGRRKSNVLAIVWGKENLSMYEIHPNKTGARFSGEIESWYPIRSPIFHSLR